MQDLNIENIIQLVESGEEEKAAELVSEFFTTFQPEDRGAAYVALASAYTKLIAQNRTELANVLESQLAELRKLDKEEKALLDEVDLAQVRNQLQS